MRRRSLQIFCGSVTDHSHLWMSTTNPKSIMVLIVPPLSFEPWKAENTTRTVRPALQRRSSSSLGSHSDFSDSPDPWRFAFAFHGFQLLLCSGMLRAARNKNDFTSCAVSHSALCIPTYAGASTQPLASLNHTTSQNDRLPRLSSWLPDVAE
jgi:hypothetical protein